MKGLTKRILFLICTLVLVIAVVGCRADENEGAKADNENVKAQEIFSQELASYFPSVEGTVLRYYGTAEYGQTLTLNKVIENEGNLNLNFKGEILDVSGGEGPSRDELLFETEYEINKDSVQESQINEDRRFSQSIIRKQIILKAPVKEGTKWKQTVNIDEKKYEAETEITEVSKDENGKNLVKTETIIKGLDFYPEKTYREIKVYKEGKGLVEFNNTILLSGAEGEEPTPFEFGYRLFEQE